MKEFIKNKEIFINKNDEKINQTYICQAHNKTFENNCQDKKNICLNTEYLRKTKKRINHYIYFYLCFKQVYYFKKKTKINKNYYGRNKQ